MVGAKPPSRMTMFAAGVALLATGVPACGRVLTAIVSTASHFATHVNNLDGDQRLMVMSGERRGLAPRAGADWRCRKRASTLIKS